MYRKFWIVSSVVVLLVINAIILSRRPPHPRLWAENLQKQQQEEMQEIRKGRRAIPMFTSDRLYDLIGVLAKYPVWIKTLAFNPEQSRAIIELDELLHASRNYILIADSEYPAKGLESYQKYLARSDSRLRSALGHARRVVALGLLTEPQAALVMQRYLLSGSLPFHRLYENNVQDLLGFTKKQKDELATLEKTVGTKNGDMKLVAMAMSPDQKTRDEAGTTMAAQGQESNAAAKNLLTPEQLKIWAQLTKERPPLAEPPDLPLLPEAEAARINLAELSPTFRTIAQKNVDLELADDQKKCLQKLEYITREGIWWIRSGQLEGAGDFEAAGQNHPHNIDQRLSEFIKQAEQVALLGILTEQQAEQVQAAPCPVENCP